MGLGSTSIVAFALLPHAASHNGPFGRQRAGLSKAGKLWEQAPKQGLVAGAVRTAPATSQPGGGGSVEAA